MSNLTCLPTCVRMTMIIVMVWCVSQALASTLQHKGKDAIDDSFYDSRYITRYSYIYIDIHR